MLSQSPLLRFITWPNYKGKLNQLQHIINGVGPLELFCSICHNMIYSNCFHAWSKTHTDNSRGIWIWWGLQRIMEGMRQEERKEHEKKNRGRQEFWCGGWIKALVFPLEAVLMPYWMQLLMNRCAVCGHCDPRSTSCTATHPIEVHLSRSGRGRCHPSSGLRWRDSRTAAPSLRPSAREGGGTAQPPQDYSSRV